MCGMRDERGERRMDAGGARMNRGEKMARVRAQAKLVARLHKRKPIIVCNVV